MDKIIFELSLQSKILSFFLRVDFHSRVIFTFVNKTEATFERSRVDVKVERGSTLTCSRDHVYIASISFTRVKFTQNLSL